METVCHKVFVYLNYLSCSFSHSVYSQMFLSPKLSIDISACLLCVSELVWGHPVWVFLLQCFFRLRNSSFFCRWGLWIGALCFPAPSHSPTHANTAGTNKISTSLRRSGDRREPFMLWHYFITLQKTAPWRCFIVGLNIYNLRTDTQRVLSHKPQCTVLVRVEHALWLLSL